MVQEIFKNTVAHNQCNLWVYGCQIGDFEISSLMVYKRTFVDPLLKMSERTPISDNNKLVPVGI